MRPSIVWTVFVLFPLLVSSQYGVLQKASLYAKLSDSVSGSGASGVAVVALNPTTQALTLTVQHTCTSPVMGIYLVDGSGAVLLSFSPLGNGTYYYDSLSTQELLSFLTGGVYNLTVATEAFPIADLAGRVMVTPPGSLDPYYYTVVAMESLITTSSSLSTYGGLVAALVWTAPDVLVVDLAYSDSRITNVVIKDGALGTDGTATCNIGTALSVTCSEGDSNGLNAGLYYIEAYDTNGVALYRGQITQLTKASATRQYNMYSLIDPIIPAAAGRSGLGLFSVDMATKTMKFDIWTDEDVVEAYIYVNATTRLTELCDYLIGECGELPLSGVTRVFTDLEILSILRGDFFVQVYYFNGVSNVASLQGNIVSSKVIDGSAYADTKYAAFLSGPEVLPPTPSTKIGHCLFRLISSPKSINIVCGTTVAGGSQIVISYGPDAVIGFDSGSQTSLFSGAVALMSNVTVTLGNVAFTGISQGLVDGTVYLSIRSATYPSGEIRGQVGAMTYAAPRAPTHYGFADASQVIVSPIVYSDAVGLVVATYDSETQTALLRVFVNATTSPLTSVALYEGAKGANGDLIAVVYTGSGPLPIVVSTPQLTFDQSVFLLSGNVYVVISTQTYPNGELRCQLTPGGDDPTTFVAVAENWQLVPVNEIGLSATSSSAAVAVMTINSTTLETTYSLFTSFSNTSITEVGVFYGANPGSIATAFFPLPPWAPTIGTEYGTVSAAAAVATRVGATYVAFNTTDYPLGFIRGQFTSFSPLVAPAYPASYSFIFPLTAGQVVPPSTSTAEGLAFIAFNPEDNTLDVSIWHSLFNASYVTLSSAPNQTNGLVSLVICSDNYTCESPINLETSSLSAAQLRDLSSGLLYLTISSTDYPFGAMRGQLVEPTVTQARAGSGSGSQVSPSVNLDSHCAIYMYLDEDDEELVHFTVWHDVVQASFITLNFAPVGQNADVTILANFGVAVDLGALAGTLSSPFSGTFDLDTVDTNWNPTVNYLTDQAYLTVATLAQPNGVARAQAVSLVGLPRLLAGPGDMSAAQPTTSFAELTGAGVTPPVTTTFSGIAFFYYSPADMTLSYNVVHNIPQVQVTGIALFNTLTSTTLLLSSTGVGLTQPLSVADVVAFLSGSYIITVSTTTNPNGEIADVITRTYGTVAVYTVLATGDMSSPKGTGFGAAAAIVRDDGSIFSVSSNPLVTTLQAYFHPTVNILGEPENSNPLPTCIEPLGASTCTLGATNLNNGLYSLRFLSDDPAGSGYASVGGLLETVYVGQVIPGAPFAPVAASSHAASLAPLTATGPVGTSSGLATLQYSWEFNAASLKVWHNVPNPSGLTVIAAGTTTIYTAVAGDDLSSPVTLSLTSLTMTQLYALISGAAEVTLTSSDDTENPVSGTLSTTGPSTGTTNLLNFVAHCTSAEVTPPITTDLGESCAAYFSYRVSDGTISYKIWHNVNGPTSVRLYYGAGVGVGQTAPGLATLAANAGASASPVVGSVLASTFPGLTSASFNGNAYVSIQSTTNNNGATRGQTGAMYSAVAPQATHVAFINGEQEVPPANSQAAAAAIVTFNPTTRTVHYQIHFSGYDSILTKIHLHNGPMGVNGPLKFPLAGAGTTVPISDPLIGETPPLTVAEAIEFLSGNYYFNIHTSDFPNGESRGQILYSASSLAGVATGVANVPAQPSSLNSGILIASVDTYGLSTVSVHTSLDEYLTGTYLYSDVSLGETLASVGTYMFPLDACSPACSESYMIEDELLPTGATVSATFGRTQVQFRSYTYPSGELTGQVTPLQYSVIPSIPTASTFYVELNESLVVPPANSDDYGVASCSLENNRTLYVSLYHTVSDATSIGLYRSTEVGAAGTLVASLAPTAATAASPAVVYAVLDDTTVADLYAGLLYLQVASTGSPNGAIRGNMYASMYERIYGALELDGSEVVPPVISTTGGALFVSITGTSLRYLVVHNVMDLLEVSLNMGEIGSAGPVLFNLSMGATVPLTSPLMGTIELTGDERLYMDGGLLYVSFLATSYPAGICRGQIFPATVNGDGFLDYPMTTSSPVPAPIVDEGGLPENFGIILGASIGGFCLLVCLIVGVGLLVRFGGLSSCSCSSCCPCCECDSVDKYYSGPRSTLSKGSAASPTVGYDEEMSTLPRPGARSQSVSGSGGAQVVSTPAAATGYTSQGYDNASSAAYNTPSGGYGDADNYSSGGGYNAGGGGDGGGGYGDASYGDSTATADQGYYGSQGYDAGAGGNDYYSATPAPAPTQSLPPVPANRSSNSHNRTSINGGMPPPPPPPAGNRNSMSNARTSMNGLPPPPPPPARNY